MTGAVWGTCREKLYHELSFESLESRRWYRKLCCFNKVLKSQSPSYLFDIIPTAKRTYISRNNDKLPHFKIKHNYFKNSFSPSTVIEWNKLDFRLGLSLGLSHLWEHKFKLNFRDTLNPICNCGEDIETSYLTFFTVHATQMKDQPFWMIFKALI